MEKKVDKNTELFRLMCRVRRAWCGISPCKALSKSQFATLLLIFQQSEMNNCADHAGETGYVTITALAAEMQQSLPALSQRVRVLEDMGYVERVPDPTDRRITGLQLTPEGMQVMRKAKQRFDGVLSQALEQLGEENSEKLIELMTQLAAVFEKDAHKPEGDCKQE